jgi:hypothetical protein
MQVAHLEVRDVLGLTAELRLGLRVNSVGASEAVEVIHVDRSQVGLQRVEHARERHRLLLRLHSVDVRIELRSAVLERCVSGVWIELRLLARFAHYLVGDAGKLVVAVRPPILNEQLESARVAEALHGRRRHCENDGILDGAELLVERGRDRARGQILGRALLERRQDIACPEPE